MKSSLQLKNLRQNWLQYLPLAVAILAISARLIPGERLIDDAYITFRYARNIVNGLGFAYNPGQQVLGTTTPLYTLLLAGFSLLFGTNHLPQISVVLNALADGLTCALLVPLGAALGGRKRIGLAAGILYAVAPYSVTFAIGGMETSVFVLLLVSTALLYLRNHEGWAVTAALALLTRPDALIFIGPIALDFSMRWLRSVRVALKTNSRMPWSQVARPLGLALVILLPWLLFATFYFGSPIPHSIAAKVAAYHLRPIEGFISLIQHYTTPFFEQNLFSDGRVLLLFLVVYIVLMIAGGLAAFQHNTRSLAIAVYPVTYLIVFSVANPLIFRWYITPPLPFYILLILTSLAHIADSLASRPPLAARVAPLVFILPCLFFLGLSLRAWDLVPDHGPQQPAPDMAWFKLEELYTQVGTQLKAELKPGQVIAAGDIGALGYFSNAKILDTLGLVSPLSSTYYPLPADQLVINYAIPAKLITDQKPDYVVFLEVYGRRTLLVDPEFLKTYRLQQKIETDIYGSDGMLIYQRVEN